jgi:hypothetical protein
MASATVSATIGHAAMIKPAKAALKRIDNDLESSQLDCF